MGGYTVSAGIQIDASSNNIDFMVTVNTIVRTTGDWIADGLTNGDTITIAGSVSNDGVYTIIALTALQIDTTEAIVTESMTSGTLSVSPPYLHGMTNANVVPSYTIEHVINPSGTNSYSHKFIGAKCEELSLTFTKGNPVICEATFFAASYEKEPTPGTNTINSDVPYEFHSSTTLTINSVEYGDVVRQMTITMGNGLEREYGLDSRDATEITEGKRKCMITFEVWETDDTLQDLFQNRSNIPIVVVFTRGTGTWTITTTNGKLFGPTWDLGSNGVADILPVRVIGDWTIDFVDNETTYDD